MLQEYFLLHKKPVGLFWENESGQHIFSLGRPQQNWSLISEERLRSILDAMDERQQEEFWGEVLVEGDVSMYGLQQVADQMSREKESLFLLL